MKQRISSWGLDPLVIPRFVLTLKYLAFVVLGILAVFGGVKSLEATTFLGYTYAWGGGLIISATLSAIFSFRERWEKYEKWSALLLTGLMVAWSFAAMVRFFAEGMTGSSTGWFALFMLTFLPGTRTVSMLRRSGRGTQHSPVVLERGVDGS